MNEEVRKFADELIAEIVEHRDFCATGKTPFQKGYALAHDHIIELIKLGLERYE